MKFQLVPAGEFEMGDGMSKHEFVSVFGNRGDNAAHTDQEFPNADMDLFGLPRLPRADSLN